MTDQRLSNRQIATLRHLAICTSNGSQVTLTREQREAMTPLWPSRPILFKLYPEDQAKEDERMRNAGERFRALMAAETADLSGVVTPGQGDT